MDKSRAASVEQEFRNAGAEIVAAHPGADLVMNNHARITLAGQPADGLMAMYLWSENGNGVGSILWMGKTADRMVKIRLSYARPEPDDQAVAATRYAMTTLGDAAAHICEPDRLHKSDTIEPSFPEAP